MAGKQDAKRKKIRKKLEVLELLSDQKKRGNKEATKEKKLKLRIVLYDVTKPQVRN